MRAPSDVMEEYDREMRALGGRLLDLFFMALGLTDVQFATGETERRIRETWTATMHPILYVRQKRISDQCKRFSAMPVIHSSCTYLWTLLVHLLMTRMVGTPGVRNRSAPSG
jgi:hypothetical protein